MKRIWIPISILVLCAAALITFSCSNGNDPFEEYRGVNLIEGTGFDAGEWTADRSESYYMNFEAVTAADAGGTTGLPDGAAVYRLEVPNLMPDGDFESTSAGPLPTPTGWSATGGTNQIVSPGIYGQSLEYNITETQMVDFTLSNLADGFIANKYYLIRFVLEASSAVFDYHNGVASLNAPWILAGLSGITAFPTANDDPEILAISSGGTFSINTPGTGSSVQGGQLDNFRIIRTDIPYGLRLQVPSIQEGRPELIPGTYRFSVYIKQEDSASVTPAVKNRFRSAGVTLQIKGPHDSVSDFTVATAFHPDDEDADWTSWQLISTDIEDLYPSAKEEPNNAVTLSIYPTDVYDLDIGSVLIAAPSLEFIPEGSSN